MPLESGGGPIRHARTTITFDGTSGSGQAATVVTVFTTTGRVFVHALTAFCTTLLGEGGATATISLGTTNQVSRFVGATDSVDIDANKWWVTTTPTTGSIDLPDALQSVIVSEDIIVNPVTQDTDAGVIVFDCLYESLTNDGALS